MPCISLGSSVLILSISCSLSAFIKGVLEMSVTFTGRAEVELSYDLVTAYILASYKSTTCPYSPQLNSLSPPRAKLSTLTLSMWGSG